jgi:TonB family protein
MKFEAPKITPPQPPEPKPIQMEAKLEAPVIKQAKPAVVLAPQPKAALAAAMPAQTATMKASTSPVHLGQTFGVTPNPNARGTSTVASIGNPYGGLRGPAVAPHGVVGSIGIGNGLKAGSNAGVMGHVASVEIPGAAKGAPHGPYGNVASVKIPSVAQTVATQQTVIQPVTTNVEVLSKPAGQYTAEARQLRVQGDVVLKVTFLAAGHVVVQGVVHGLGHGLDEEARRVAQQIRFHPATRNGQAVDTTANITITFQLA